MSTVDKTVVIGVGNWYRRDDGVGLYVSRQLQLAKANIDVIESSGAGFELLELWEGLTKVIIVDAVAAMVPAGTIYCLNALEEEFPECFSLYSSHNCSIRESIALGKQLQQLPRQLILYGIVGEDFANGTGLSAKVAAAADKVVAEISNI